MWGAAGRRKSQIVLRKLNENAWSSGIVHVWDSRYMIMCCVCCGTCVQVYCSLNTALRLHRMCPNPRSRKFFMIAAKLSMPLCALFMLTAGTISRHAATAWAQSGPRRQHRVLLPVHDGMHSTSALLRIDSLPPKPARADGNQGIKPFARSCRL